MIAEFVYTRLEAIYSPAGIGGWQYAYECGLDDDWRAYIETHLVYDIDRHLYRSSRHRGHCVVAHAQVIDNHGTNYARIHDASYRRGVIILHGVLVPEDDLARHYNGDWRSVARTRTWCRSADDIRQQFGLRWLDITPTAEPWWSAILAQRERSTRCRHRTQVLE